MSVNDVMLMKEKGYLKKKIIIGVAEKILKLKKVE